jgi:hypothetical protein
VRTVCRVRLLFQLDAEPPQLRAQFKPLLSYIAHFGCSDGGSCHPEIELAESPLLTLNGPDGSDCRTFGDAAAAPAAT